MTCKPSACPPPEAVDIPALRERYRQERSLRLRPEGQHQYVPPADHFAHDTYDRDPHMPVTPRDSISEDLDVLVLGGGCAGCSPAITWPRPGSPASASSIRPATSAAPGTGTAIRARSATSRATCYLPLLEEIGYMPKEKYSYGTEICEHCPAHRPRHFDLYDGALFQTRVTLDALGRGRCSAGTSRPTAATHDARPLRGHGLRPAQPAQAAGHPRHRELQGPQLPHQPLGLRLHRRRHERAA